jgi:hypothetical protein
MTLSGGAPLAVVVGPTMRLEESGTITATAITPEETP